MNSLLAKVNLFSCGVLATDSYQHRSVLIPAFSQISGKKQLKEKCVFLFDNSAKQQKSVDYKVKSGLHCSCKKVMTRDCNILWIPAHIHVSKQCMHIAWLHFFLTFFYCHSDLPFTIYQTFCCLFKVSDRRCSWFYNVFIILLVKNQQELGSNGSIDYSGLKPAWFLPAHEQLHMVIKTHCHMCQCKWGSGMAGSCRQDCIRMNSSSLDATDWHWTACQQALQGVRIRPILKYIKILFERNVLKDG